MASHHVHGKPLIIQEANTDEEGMSEIRSKNVNVCEKQHPSLWKPLGDRHVLDSYTPFPLIVWCIVGTSEADRH